MRSTTYLVGFLMLSINSVSAVSQWGQCKLLPSYDYFALLTRLQVAELALQDRHSAILISSASRLTTVGHFQTGRL